MSVVSAVTGPGLSEPWWRWLRTWSLLSTPGVVIAALLWGPVTLIWAVATPGVVAATCYAAYWLTAAPTPASDARRPSVVGLVTWAGRVALCVAVLTVATAALASVSMAGALCLVLLAGATTPPAAGVARRMVSTAGSGRHPHPMPAHEVVESRSPLLRALLAEPAQQMSNSQLCHAWRRSFSALQAAHTLAERETVVALRQGFLDEMEVRNAAALSAWLDSGARAASGPERYLNDGPNDGTDDGRGHRHVA